MGVERIILSRELSLDKIAEIRQQQFCGEIRNYDTHTGMAEILVKNKFLVGDKLEFIHPDGNHDIIVDRMEDLQGNEMQETSGGGYEVKIPMPSFENNLGLLSRYY